MQIQHFLLDLRTLDPLTKEERGLLLWTMVVLNELNLLHATAAMSKVPPECGTPLDLVRQSQALFFMTLLAGKQNEAWEAFQRDFARATCFTERLPHLSDYARTSYEKRSSLPERTQSA